MFAFPEGTSDHLPYLPEATTRHDGHLDILRAMLDDTIGAWDVPRDGSALAVLPRAVRAQAQPFPAAVR